jgi:hypothetical protein
VRVVSGHFFFVYIHPFMDGNGRIGEVPDECDDGGRCIPLDDHSCQ